jgi:hypothetical protein
MQARFWIACAWLLLFQQASFGQPIVVANDNIRLRPSPFDSHLLNVARSPSSDVNNCEDLVCTYVVFDYEDGVLEFGPNQFLTLSGDWYLVSAGDIFSKETKGAYPAMFVDRDWGPPVAVGTSDFYLGVNLDILGAYGWVQLRPMDDMMTMVANAIAYDSRGIVVGTTQVVPEPISRVMLSVALAGVISSLRIARR